MTTRAAFAAELPPKRRLLTVQEAARYLGVSVTFMYRATRQRRVPVTRIGRSVRFDPASLAKFILRKTTEPVDRPPRR